MCAAVAAMARRAHGDAVAWLGQSSTGRPHRGPVLPARHAEEAGGSPPSLSQPSGIQKFRKCSASELGRCEGELAAGPVKELCVHVCIGP